MPENYRRVIPETVVPGRRLGRNVNHDPRSLRFLVQAPVARTLVSVTHEREVPVFDQGNLGSCTGNAAVGAVGTAPLYETLDKNHPDLDEPLAVNVYSAATVLDDYPGTYPPTDTGSDGLSVAKACKNMGLISGYLHATNVAAMQAALQDTPVIVGVNWYEGFDNPDSNGLVKISGDVRGGHEFEVLGLDLDSKTFLAVNSWGTSYGVNGRFSFSFDTMDQLFSEEGDCTQLLPLTVPSPTPSPTDPDLAEWWADTKEWAANPHQFHNSTIAAGAATKLATKKGLV
jgi:hypothetical protein